MTCIPHTVIICFVKCYSHYEICAGAMHIWHDVFLLPFLTDLYEWHRATCR